MLSTSNLQKAGFVLAHSSTVEASTAGKAQQQDPKVAGYRKQRMSGAVGSAFLPFVQSKTPSHRLVLPILRIGHPTLQPHIDIIPHKEIC